MCCNRQTGIILKDYDIQEASNTTKGFAPYYLKEIIMPYYTIKVRKNVSYEDEIIIEAADLDTAEKSAHYLMRSGADFSFPEFSVLQNKKLFVGNPRSISYELMGSDVCRTDCEPGDLVSPPENPSARISVE